MPQVQTAPAIRRPWNSGRIIGPKPPLKPTVHLGDPPAAQECSPSTGPGALQSRHRQQLRGCNLVRLRVSDRRRATVIQQKTHRPVPFELTAPTREALTAWLKVRDGGDGDWL